MERNEKSIPPSDLCRAARMIFVTVGTEKFDELVKKMDEIALDLGEKVTIQIGKGRYEPKNCKYFRIALDLDQYYEKADLIVAHGGAGTIFELLGKNKKIIGISNPEKPGQHQEDILKALSQQNYLIWWTDLNRLKEAIKNTKETKIKEYQKPECKIAETITKRLSEWFR
jgi:beta-1,4-N-acetylglucosaminyltransferase